MEIKILPLGYIGTNCYLIQSEKAAVVIDPGFVSQGVLEFLKENGEKERAILLTHAHFDHISGVPDLKDNTEVLVYAGMDERENLLDPQVNLTERFHAKTRGFNADRYVADGEILKVGDLEFKVFHTPGHTTGGVSYLMDGKLFSGDTLFYESVGRTDFPGGDFAVLENSIKRLYTLPDDTVVFPGHGESTTIGHEKKYNPFVRK